MRLRCRACGLREPPSLWSNPLLWMHSARGVERPDEATRWRPHAFAWACITGGTLERVRRVVSHEGPMRQPASEELRPLRRPRDSSLSALGAELRGVPRRHRPCAEQEPLPWPNRQRQGLRARECSLGDVHPTGGEHMRDANDHVPRDDASVCSVGAEGRHQSRPAVVPAEGGMVDGARVEHPASSPSGHDDDCPLCSGAGSGLLGGAEAGTVAVPGAVAAAALPPSVSAALGAVRRTDGG